MSNFYITLIKLVFLFFFISCSNTRPSKPFDAAHVPESPNYKQLQYWAAHPAKMDSADLTPSGLVNKQDISQADVFFLYPTSFFDAPEKWAWNADVNDEKLNVYSDASSILYQASIFNEVGRIFAPRYRQAHIHAFTTKDKHSADKAFDIAYSDVSKAFEHFLNVENKNRPIILAAHSQGALHLIRLLKEYFDGKPLQQRLVVAYVVGYPVPVNALKHLKVCANAKETSCICSWRSFKKGYDPKLNRNGKEVIITNPLSWTITEEPVPAENNKGAVLFDFYAEPVKKLNGAQIKNNILWIDKPKFKGSWLYWSPNFHRGDFNLFYMNVRENAHERLNAFWRN